MPPPHYIRSQYAATEEQDARETLPLGRLEEGEVGGEAEGRAHQVIPVSVPVASAGRGFKGRRVAARRGCVEDEVASEAEQRE